MGTTSGPEDGNGRAMSVLPMTEPAGNGTVLLVGVGNVCVDNLMCVIEMSFLSLRCVRR